MNHEVLKTRSYKGTWGGRKAVESLHHLDKRPLGLRVHVMVWDDSNDVDVKLIKGDGRRDDFEVRAHLVVTRPEVEATIAHLVRNSGEPA